MKKKTLTSKKRLRLKSGYPILFERNTLIVLFLFSIILLLAAFWIEFGNTDNIFDSHKNFIENILLGMSASSCISFIALYVPFCNRKNQEMHEFYTMLKTICTKNKMLYEFLENGDCSRARAHTVGLIKDIDVFYDTYNKMNFTSMDCKEKESLICDKMREMLAYVLIGLDHIDALISKRKTQIEKLEKTNYDIMIKKMCEIISNHMNSYQIPFPYSVKEYEEEALEISKSYFITQIDDNLANFKEKYYVEMSKSLCELIEIEFQDALIGQWTKSGLPLQHFIPR